MSCSLRFHTEHAELRHKHFGRYPLSVYLTVVLCRAVRCLWHGHCTYLSSHGSENQNKKQKNHSKRFVDGEEVDDHLFADGITVGTDTTDGMHSVLRTIEKWTPI